jgi:hypothetical protein
MTFSISSVTSKDGTTIGYRQLGHGPGLVLVGGGMQTAHHFDQLAEALADTFTRFSQSRLAQRVWPEHRRSHSS